MEAKCPAPSLAEVEKTLLRLKRAGDIKTPNWSVTEICLHCAQTVDYAMTGYPQLKPAWIRATIGKLAIRRFLRQGYMSRFDCPCSGRRENRRRYGCGIQR